MKINENVVTSNLFVVQNIKKSPIQKENRCQRKINTTHNNNLTEVTIS